MSSYIKIKIKGCPSGGIGVHLPSEYYCDYHSRIRDWLSENKITAKNIITGLNAPQPSNWATMVWEINNPAHRTLFALRWA